jgi:S-formylglutathione hydrolase FrmB
MKKYGTRKYILIIVTLIFVMSNLSFEAYGQGSVIIKTFYSKSVKDNRSVQIYLPEGYNQMDSTVRYPVIYFLHGAGVNHTYYTEVPLVLNDLIGTKKILPVIVVKPDGSTGPWGGSCYTNSELYGDFEDYIVFDLIKFIDSAYNTNTSRKARAIMGHSTGAFGAMKLALKHPDVYCSVVANSGPLDFKHFSDWIPMILAENGGPPVRLYNPYCTTTMYWTYIFYTYAGAFSPNLNNSPYKVDFPIDSVGNWIDSVWNRWALHDPLLLARNITPSSDLTIFFDCGIYDEYKMYNSNKAFADTLDKLGLSYEFLSFNGSHMNQLGSRFTIAFQFLDSVMNKSGATWVANYQNKNIPQKYILYQNYPNPFNPSTKIKYSVPTVGTSFMKFIRLKVYDILGNEVATLVNEEKPAGTYGITWDADNLPSGVYFYRLQAGDFIQTKKMILMR